MRYTLLLDYTANIHKYVQDIFCVENTQAMYLQRSSVGKSGCRLPYTCYSWNKWIWKKTKTKQIPKPRNRYQKYFAFCFFICVRMFCSYRGRLNCFELPEKMNQLLQPISAWVILVESSQPSDDHPLIQGMDNTEMSGLWNSDLLNKFSAIGNTRKFSVIRNLREKAKLFLLSYVILEQFSHGTW